MSDEERKPFAEVAPSATQRDWWTLKLAGGYVGGAWDDAGEGRAPSLQRIRDIAAGVNAAVDLREAELRGALKRLWKAAAEVARPAPEFAELIAAATNAVEVIAKMPAPPRFVPVEQLEAERATVRKMTAAFAALDPHEYANGALVAAYLQAEGFRKPPASGTTITIDPSSIVDGDTITIGGVVFRADPKRGRRP